MHMAVQGWREARQAIRAARRRPSAFLVAVVTIALVTAAAGAVSAVAAGAFVRALPFPQPDRLVRLYTMPPGARSFSDANPFGPREFVRFREQPGPFEAIEGIWVRDRAIAGDGEPESIQAGEVSAGFLPLLGGAAALGRTFTKEEDLAAAKVVVLGHGFWTRRFGADRGILGRTLVIDREPHEIIGVMPPGFEPAFTPTELWTPLGIRDGRLILPAATFIQTVARLQHDLGVEPALARARVMYDAVRRESPATHTGWEIGVLPLREAQFGQQRPAIVMLVASVIVLALIAAVNLAHLALADVMSRRGEIALRLALGAGRRDLLRWHLAERLLVIGAGGGLGLAAAALVLPTLMGLDPRGLASVIPISMDWPVAIAALAFVAVVTLAASTLPVWRAAHRDVATALTESGRRASSSRGQAQLRTLLVAVEMGLAVLLLASGALLVDGFRRLAATPPGFTSAGVITAQLRLAESAYPNEAARTAVVMRVVDRIREVPGVIDASTTLNRFVPGFAFVTLLHIDGHPTPDGAPHTVQFRRVTPGYFRTLGIPEIAGRTFDARDVKGGQPVAVVSDLLAKRYWPNEDPIGRTVRRGANAPMTVIGIVGDVSDVGFGQAPQPTIYMPYFQNNTVAAPVALVVRSDRTLADLVPALKRAVWEIDPAQPLANVSTLDDFLGASLGPQRFRSTLLTAFAAIGLLLACVGIFGVTERTVIERRREAGVRLALGASARRVWWTVSSRALAGVAWGAGLGLIAALGVNRALTVFLPELRDASALTTALPALALLTVTGLLSAIVPARRASRVDPLVALRGD
jgi:predicted permease